jgi:predicted DNA-binding ArsR family transcriptional regulator
MGGAAVANEREVSLDDLAAMVSAGFGDLQGQLSSLRDEVEQRFDGVERRFDRVERDLAEVKYLLTDVVRRDEFLDLKQRVEEVERRLGSKA